MAYDSTIPDPDNFGLEDLLKMKENFSQLEQNGAGIIGYNNSNSGLTAEKVQGAIDLLSELITTNSNIISTITGAASGWADCRITEHNLDVADPPNGYYVRWENGLQVAWFRSQAVTVDTLTGALYAKSTIWIFPAAFVVPPYVIPGAERAEIGIGAAFCATYQPTTRTAAYLTVYDAVSGRKAFAVAIAIGRWK